MPSYNVEHSFPLTAKQKADLAARITELHARTFTTPSVFVQVKFYPHDASALDHFIGGKPTDVSTNRILGYVRSSPKRTKEHFDKLGEEIEKAWYVVLGEQPEEEDEEAKKEFEKNKKETPRREKDLKELISITFVGGIIVREKGFVIPEVGDEEAWMKTHRKEFQERADLGDESLKEMLQEVEDRDDLKSWRA